MARIALVTGCFLERSLRETLRVAAQGGYRYFETWQMDSTHSGDLKLGSPPDPTSCVKMLRKASGESGVLPTVIGGFNDFVQADSAAFDEEIAKVIAYIDLAEAMGCKLVRIMGGEPKYNVSITACVDLIVAGYRACMSHAQRKGITLALENHGYITNNAPLVLEILDRVGSEHLRCNLDASNYRWAGYPLQKVYEFYRLIAPYTAYAHLKNGDGRSGSVRNYTATTLDKGEMDLRVFVKTLADAGFDGEWGIEYEGEEEPGDAQARNLRFATALLNEHGYRVE